MATNKKSSEEDLTRYRWEVFGRCLIAVVGGYAFTIALRIFLTQALPIAKSSAVMTANLLSFAIYTIAIIWVFSVKAFRQLWWGLAGSTIFLVFVLLFLE
ncbi:MAG: hypothetical protein B0W54_03005 [Cellvibrio sp. 79]|nr:MAG: hypothetical protein B0W54_03005 [Cellvibrio sp. 79]